MSTQEKFYFLLGKKLKEKMRRNETINEDRTQTISSLQPIA